MELLQTNNMTGEVARLYEPLVLLGTAVGTTPEEVVGSSTLSQHGPPEQLKEIRHEIDTILQEQGPPVGVEATQPVPIDLREETSDNVRVLRPVDEIQSQSSPKKSRLEPLREIVGLERSLTLRGVRPEDLDELVTADMRAFGAVYKISDMTPEDRREDLMTKFGGRIEMLGSRFIRILEKDDKIIGSIMACPTSKPPEDFISWEDTTDDGTLKTTYDPTGRYLYVVSLSTTPEASDFDGGDMLMANMIGRIIGSNYQAYFESRVPGLRGWVRRQCRENQTRLKDLSQEELKAYAEQYFGLTTIVNDKAVPFDPLLRIYESMGCSFVKIVPDAYQDAQSLNFGVVCHYDNPLPSAVRRIPGVPQLFGAAIRAVSHSNWLTRKVF